MSERTFDLALIARAVEGLRDPIGLLSAGLREELRAALADLLQAVDAYERLGYSRGRFERLTGTAKRLSALLLGVDLAAPPSTQTPETP